MSDVMAIARMIAANTGYRIAIKTEDGYGVRFRAPFATRPVEGFICDFQQGESVTVDEALERIKQSLG